MAKSEQNDLKNVQSRTQEILGKTNNCDASKCAKSFLEKTSQSMTSASGIKQFALGGVSGWCTGFMSTRVGKTVAISVGGTVILVAAAHQAGLVNVNWDKFGTKAGEMATKVENKIPAIKTNVGKYAKSNHMFAAGFVGGFLLGLCS